MTPAEIAALAAKWGRQAEDWLQGSRNPALSWVERNRMEARAQERAECAAELRRLARIAVFQEKAND